MSWLRSNLPGLLYAGLIAVAAFGLGRCLPVVGAPVLGILLGMLARGAAGRPALAAPGLAFASRKVLQASVVALGGGLSFIRVLDVGRASLAVMLVTIAAAFIAALLAGRLLGTARRVTALIGMGTAICGGSAIVAIAPIIEAEDRDIAYAISTVFLFNVAAVIVFPAAGHLLHFSQSAFGLWAGTAINDTSSVVAAAYSYGAEAGAYATIVKLTRTVMIVPLSLLFALAVYLGKRRAAGGAVAYSFRRTFPWFILLFLAASLLNTLGIIAPAAAAAATLAGRGLMVLALSAIGLNADFGRMRAAGFQPFVLGLIVWAAVAATSLAAQRLTGQW